MNDRKLSSNIISTLPQTIIETILCLLPIEMAARTSILSREWRYKWTTIPKLRLGWHTVKSEEVTEDMQPTVIAGAWKNMDRRCKLFNDIHQVLLMRQGPIQEFTLEMDKPCHCFELDQMIFHLSRNHAVKKLTLKFYDMPMYKLPSSAFSLHQLTDLHLEFVDLSHQPMFSGFGSLRKLCLIYVNISTKDLLHLLSNCPSLKSFSLLPIEDIGFKDCTFIELFECLPVIEDLTIDGKCVHPWLVLGSVPKELPISLIHLKYFHFSGVYYANSRDELTFLAVLIKCSPNLEKITVQTKLCDNNGGDNEICPGILEEYSDVWLEHLKGLTIEFLTDFKRQTEFVKFILVRSPNLKKVRISGLINKDEELDMLKTLLRAPRVSPVEIDVVTYVLEEYMGMDDDNNDL